MRSVAEPELRQPVQHHAGQPGHHARVGQPSVRLAVGCGAAAGDSAAPLRGRRVQSPVVEQLLRAPTTRRIGPTDFDQFTIVAPTHPDLRDQRPAADVPEAQWQQPAGRDEQLPDVPARLRRRELLLAGNRLHGQLADAKWPRAPGWLQHWRRASRPLRCVGRAARAGNACSPRDGVAGERVQGRRGLADELARPRDLHASQGGRAGQRHPAFAGQHRAVDDRDGRRHQRRRACGKLQRDGRRTSLPTVRRRLRLA